MAAIAARFGFQHLFQDNLRDALQSNFAEKLSLVGLDSQLAQAHFVEGEGIHLKDLKIFPAGTETTTNRPVSKLEIYEARLRSRSTMVDLISENCELQFVEIRRAKMTIVRDENGRLDFDEVIQKIQQLGPTNDKPFPISFTDCELVVFDTSQPSADPIRLTNLNISVQPITHQGRPLLQIGGNVKSAAVSHTDFTVYIDQASNWWQATINANNAQLSKDLLNLFQGPIAADLKSVPSLQGRLNVEASANGALDLRQAPTFQVKGELTEFSVDDKRLPQPLSGVSGTFTANNNGFTLTNFHGRMGQGNFSASYRQSGLLERTQWAANGFVNDFNFTREQRLTTWLPTNCKKFCSDFAPEGTSNIRFSLNHDGQKLTRTIIGQLTNMAFTFHKMPYKAENCSGEVKIIDDQCEFDLRSLTSEQVIDLSGFARSISHDPTFEINITVPGELPIDQKLLHAVDAQPKLAKVIRSFNGSGFVGGIGRIERIVPRGPVKKSLDFRLKQCSIRHSGFDYPIHNISGLVQVRDSKFTFSDISGNNSSGKVGCNGTWDPTNGLDARFLCSSVPLDDQLRFALKPEIREIWNGFRPRGTLDFIRVDMTLPPGQKAVDLNVEATMNDNQRDSNANQVSIHPVWFPYLIQNLTGTFKIGGGQVTLEDMKGKHQRTWLVCQGDGRYSDSAWSVRLKDLLVGSLQVDEDLISALPGQLSAPVRQLKYQGLLNVAGEISIGGRKSTNNTQLASNSNSVHHASHTGQLSGSNQFVSRVQRASFENTARQNNSDSTSMAWNLRFDMNQAKMLIGLPIENVFGMVKLIGQYDGKSTACSGEVDIDSLILEGAQITQIKGPIWISDQRAGAGVFAQPDPRVDGENHTASQIQPGSLKGKMQKGVVNFDAQTTFGPRGQFYFQGTLNDGCLATACQELAPSLKNVEGHSFGAIRMSGDYSGTHSYRGDGMMQLRDAKIYELPVFLSLLKILRIRQADRTAFDSSNIDFTIEGETFDFNRMEFLGDAVSLIGNGKMNLERDIDLNFYSVMGRNRINIPILSELYHRGSQKILWINVDGTLDNPKTHRHVLPQLNDSLKQLFQPRETNFQNQTIRR